MNNNTYTIKYSEMINMYNDILNNIDELIVIKTKDKIIYSNNKKLDRNKIYKVKRKHLIIDNKNCIFKMYYDITEFLKDSLTKLLNRKGLKLRFKKIKNKNLSLILCDIDDFKSINDTYGHDIGDEVLINVSKILINNLSKNDIICRYGGEEFLIVSEDVNKESIYNKIENVRKKIENTKIKIYNKYLSYTMTFGISKYKSNEDIKNFLKISDDLLYVGKRNGKNQIMQQKNWN